MSTGRITTRSGIAAPTSSLLVAVKRQLEAFEENLAASIQDQQKGDRAREAMVSRLEDKISTAGALQPKLEKRMAELSGNFKGLSDEMQAQIRRVDMMDDRLCSWRHQYEEENRQKLLDLEQKVQKVSSSLRVADASMQETQKRLTHRMGLVETSLAQRLANQDDVHNRMVSLWQRLDMLEGQRFEDTARDKAATPRRSPRDAGVPSADEAATAFLSQRLADVADRVDRIFQDVHEVHSKVATQEQQTKALRTIMDTREEHFRRLSEQVEHGDWDAKLESLRQAHHEDSRQKVVHLERLEVLAKRVEQHEHGQEELRSVQHTLMHSARGNVHGDGLQHELPEAARECLERVQQVENHINSLGEAMEATRSGMDMAERVSGTMEELRELVPKVIAHDKAIRELSAGSEVSVETPRRLKQTEDGLRRLDEQFSALRSTLPPRAEQPRAGDQPDDRQSAPLRDEYSEARLQMMGEHLKALQEDVRGVNESKAQLHELKEQLSALHGERLDESEAKIRRLEEEVAAKQTAAKGLVDAQVLREELAEHKSAMEALLAERVKALGEEAVKVATELRQCKGALEEQAEANQRALAEAADAKLGVDRLVREHAEASQRALAEAADAKLGVERLALLSDSVADTSHQVASDLLLLKQEQAEANEANQRALAEAADAKLGVERIALLSGTVGDISHQVANDLLVLKQDLESLAGCTPRGTEGSAEPAEVQGVVESLRKEVEELQASRTSSRAHGQDDVTEIKQELSRLAAAVEELRGVRSEREAIDCAVTSRIGSALADEGCQDTAAPTAPSLPSPPEPPPFEPNDGMTEDSPNFAFFTKELKDIRRQLIRQSEVIAEQGERGQQAVDEASEAKRDMAELKARVHKGVADDVMSELDGLRQQVVALKGAGASGTEVGVAQLAEAGNAERQELQRVIELATSGQHAVSDIMGQLRGLQQQLSALEISRQSPVGGNSGQDVQEYASVLLAALDARLAISPSANDPSMATAPAAGEEHVDRRHLLEMLERVLTDHENQAKAHQQVQVCIDELCAQLANLSGTVADEVNPIPGRLR